MVTDNHNLSKPPRGITGWDTDWYQNFDLLDTGVEIRDTQANRSAYSAKDGAKYLATDTEAVYLGRSGQGWVKLDTFGPTPQFDTVDTGDLTSGGILADTIELDSGLTIPVYDDLANAPAQTGSLVYATGQTGTAGFYGYAGGSYQDLGGGGTGDGATALSELSIDVSKNWLGFNITNAGTLDATTGTFDDLSTSTASVSTAPTVSTDVARLQEVAAKADDPHGNEAHSETYLTESDLSDTGTGAPSPHDNTHHSETYATTTQLDSRAFDPHGNESHNPNFSETGHDHADRTIRPNTIDAGSTSTNSLTLGTEGIINSYGDNLFVSEGALHASGGGTTATGKSHVEFHDIDDYGADPTGSGYSDTALSDAINALNDGDYLVMTNGNYRFRSPHTITNDYITVTGEGSLLTIEEDESYGSSNGFLAFKGSVNSSGSPDTTNSTAIQQGDQSITVNSTAGFSIGDDLIISEQKGPGNTHYRWGGQDGRTVAQTRSTIRHISGNTLYITRGSSYFHSSGNAGVYRVDPVKRPRVFDMHMRSAGGANTETFLVFYFTRHGLMERCYAQNVTGFAYQLFYGFRDQMVDCVSKFPVETAARGSSQNEVIRLVGGTDPVIVRPVIEDCRRGIDMNAGTHCAKIYEPLITNAQLHGVCFHSQDYSSGDGNVYGGYHIYGGRIECKAESVDNSLAHIGLGASMSANQLEVKLIGTTIVGRSAAVHTPSYADGNADNVTLKGCTFTSIPDYSGDLVKVGGSNWTIEGCTFETEGSSGDAITNSGSGFNDLKILNNHIDGDVSLGGASVTGYWFKNNYHIGAGSAPSGSGHFASDNY